MNSMTGGLENHQVFENKFNMLLPLLMDDCTSGDYACEKKLMNLIPHQFREFLMKNYDHVATGR